MKKHHRIFCLLYIFLLQSNAIEIASATSFVIRPMGEVVDDAPIIVRGKTRDSRAEWSSPNEPGKKIYTYTELLVDEVIKGEVEAKSIQIREMGGEKDGVTLEVPGTAQFKHGEDVVLLLSKPAGDGSYPLLGLSTGKYSVTRDSAGNEMVVGASSHDPYPGGAAHNHGVQNDTSGMKKWSLNDLKKWVSRPGQAQAGAPPAQNTLENQGVQTASPDRQNSATPPASPLLHSSSERGSDSPMKEDSTENGPGKSIVFFVAFAGLFLIGMIVRRRKK